MLYMALSVVFLFCRVTCLSTSTTSPTALNQCLKCCGSKERLKSPDTESIIRSRLQQSLVRSSSQTVSNSLLLLLLETVMQIMTAFTCWLLHFFFFYIDTLSNSDVFSIMLGSFLPDVVLLNITFSTGVMSIDEANGKGFNVQEHLFSDSSKAFSIEVPFSDPAVLRTVSA